MATASPLFDLQEALEELDTARYVGDRSWIAAARAALALAGGPATDFPTDVPIDVPID
jgi:hypothetical protein